MTAHEQNIHEKEEKEHLDAETEVKEQHNKKEKEDECRRLLEKQKTIIDDLTGTLKRLQAEFDNYRKRTEADQAKIVRTVEKEMLKGFLGILDDLELALKSNKEDTEFYRGVEQIHAKFLSLLNDMGCRPEPAVGKRFDPHRHQALAAEASDKEENTVIEEFQRCYCINGEVVRFARVKVAKKQDPQGKKDDEKSPMQNDDQVKED